MTNVIDFANSYMTLFTHNEGNMARIQLDAACTLYDGHAGTSETFYLIAPCRAEEMYLDTPLFKMPNYEYCGIWSATESSTIRTHWESSRERPDSGLNQQRYVDLRLAIRHHAAAILLADAAEIMAATLANVPLVAQTELRDDAQGLHALLEYPIKTMNFLRRPPRFQVDTGPIIVPDTSSTASRAIERFAMAYLVYNTFDQAEFILRRPVAIGHGPAQAMTTDYSTVVHVPAQHRLFRVA